jgi:hypothetical protein
VIYQCCNPDCWKPAAPAFRTDILWKYCPHCGKLYEEFGFYPAQAQKADNQSFKRFFLIVLAILCLAVVLFLIFKPG